MKWLRWLSGTGNATDRRSSDDPPGASARTGVDAAGREVGICEVCGRSLHVRTRRAEYRGTVECDCGHRNHVEFHQVRTASGLVPRHVTITVGRRFEAATHEPDLRLSWRFGHCASCNTAVSLLDAFVITHTNALGDLEQFTYFCRTCHVHDDPKRGRLNGHDRSHIVDTLKFAVR